VVKFSQNSLEVQVRKQRGHLIEVPMVFAQLSRWADPTALRTLCQDLYKLLRHS
jgi:hypothetical protein